MKQSPNENELTDHDSEFNEFRVEKYHGETFDEYKSRTGKFQDYTGRKIVQLIQCDSINPFWIPNTMNQICGKCKNDKTIRSNMTNCPSCHVEFKWL